MKYFKHLVCLIVLLIVYFCFFSAVYEGSKNNPGGGVVRAPAGTTRPPPARAPAAPAAPAATPAATPAPTTTPILAAPRASAIAPIPTQTQGDTDYNIKFESIRLCYTSIPEAEKNKNPDIITSYNFVYFYYNNRNRIRNGEYPYVNDFTNINKWLTGSLPQVNDSALASLQNAEANFSNIKYNFTLLNNKNRTFFIIQLSFLRSYGYSNIITIEHTKRSILFRRLVYMVYISFICI